MSQSSKKFAKSTIYKIVCKDLTIKDVFVDATANFSARISGRKVAAKNPAKQSADDQFMYATVRAHGGFDNWDFIFIETYSCENKYELHARVRYWIEQLGANLNRAMPVEYKVIEPVESAPTCACGAFVSNPTTKTHIDSTLHQKYLRGQLESLVKNLEANLIRVPLEPKSEEKQQVITQDQLVAPTVDPVVEVKQPEQPVAAEVTQPAMLTCGCGTKLKNLNNHIHLKSEKHQKYLRAQQPVSPESGMPSLMSAINNAVRDIPPNRVRSQSVPR